MFSVQRVGYSGHQTNSELAGGPGQTREDGGVHHTSAQLVVVPHVRPRVHAGQRFLRVQRNTQTTGSVPVPGRIRL